MLIINVMQPHIKYTFLAENQMKNKCTDSVIISNESSPCALYYDHKKIEKKSFRWVYLEAYGAENHKTALTLIL